MSPYIRSLLIVLALVGAAGAPAWAQGQTDRNHRPSSERASALAREKSDIDGNNVRASVFNYGLTGRTSARPDEVPFEWPKNTRRHYIALTAVMVGAQVQSESGRPLYLVDVPLGRTDPQSSRNSWTFEPVPGYTNPQVESIARSDDPTTWPAAWPDKLEDQTDPGWRGSWNGFFGKDVFNADQELYYKMSDDLYKRFVDADGDQYFPDSTDLTRGGLGLLVETRVLAWSQILINDVVFVIHNVKNDGTKDLDRVGVSLWLADLVGDDSNRDDQPFYDLLEDVAFMTDSDGRGGPAFQGAPVGAAVATFLETPGNAVDRIDNDGDGTTCDDVTLLVGEPGSPVIMQAMIDGENPTNGVDDNGNGLVDENETHIPTAAGPNQIPQRGVGFADYIDNDGDGETGSPTATAAMVSQAAADRWNRWPANPAEGERVHLVGVTAEDVGRGFRDGIDNDATCDNASLALSEQNSPRVTAEHVAAAAGNAYGRVAVGDAGRALFQVDAGDVGKCYADGVDNDNDGAVDEGIDENIDEMVDESRSDGIDNDNDWRPGLDDTGLDGADFSNDAGEGDGRPTTGAGTNLPGEPNIDATDVSESDQIGITNVQYKAAGSLNFQNDAALFQDLMVPGNFYDASVPLNGDYDLLVSSGLFPLRAGQTERISYAVILGEDDRTKGDVQQRFRDLLTKRNNALQAYQADYRFAQAPLAPVVTAVPGNGRVTLYWNSESETSFDTFLDDIGLPAQDFEGYRVYRSTDPAFLDARVITDAFGNRQFLRPLAQFDLVNGNGGFHPTPVNGTQFYLGNNQQDLGEASNGLTHVFTDTTVTNGVQYYYAVTAYDFGAAVANISPSESPIRIRFEADGDITTGPNVVAITPNSDAVGVVPGTLETGTDGFLPRTKGYTTSRIGYEVVDPRELKEGARYRIVFRDTLVAGTRTSSDTLKTRSFSLVDVTDPSSPDTLIARSNAFLPGIEAPVVDGFRLRFFSNLFIVPEPSSLIWNDTTVFPLTFDPFVEPGVSRGLRNPQDYRIEVGEIGFGQSIEAVIDEFGTVMPTRATNVRVINTITNQPVPYAFVNLIEGNADADATAPGPALFEGRTTGEGFEVSDRLILFEPLPNGGESFTWQVGLNVGLSDRTDPGPGDVANVVTRKPFLSSDEFEFTVSLPELDVEQARTQLDSVRVVPNPYRGASLYESVNSYPNGRGERAIRFINLPPRCTIRIFTVSGHLVRVLEHNEGSNEELLPGQLMDGDEEWNLETMDNLSVSYGVYLYHVEAPGVGETTGTFAIIK